MFRNLAVPVMIFSIALFCIKFWAGQQPNLSILLMDGNFFDYFDLKTTRHAFYLWYIHCNLQILAFLFVVAAVLRWRNGFGIGSFNFALGLFAIGCVGRFVLPSFFVDDYFQGALPTLSKFNFLPTTHLSTFALGMAIAEARTPHRRYLVLALVLVYAGLSAWLMNSFAWAYILLFGVMLLYTRRVSLPRVAGPVVFALAGASLFIYLTHFQWRGLVHALGLPVFPALDVAVALFGGIATWYAWRWLTAVIASRRQVVLPGGHDVI